MDMHQADHQEPSHLHDMEPSPFRRIKSEPSLASYWEPSPPIYDPATYAPLETCYMPNPEGQTYLNLSSFNSTLPSVYFPPPAEEGILNHNYGFAYFPKIEDEGILNYDEGIGSSNSSLSPQNSPLSVEHRATPQSHQDPMSSGDCGFVEEIPSMSLPDMRHVQSPVVAVKPREQCVMCGTCKDGQWMLDGSGNFLCTTCYNNNRNNAARDNSEDTGKTKKKSLASSRRVHQICTNCHTNKTSLWRRNLRGDFVCNACGLYEKLHKKPRPEAMRKDTIQTRKRRPRNSEGKKKSEAAAERSDRSVLSNLPPYPSGSQYRHELGQHITPINLPPMRNNEMIYNYLQDQYQINYNAGPSDYQPLNNDEMNT